jgi:hypothetical protein
MNVEKICSPYTDPAALSLAFNNSAPVFVKGVYDMCHAFNLKADMLDKPGANTGNGVNFLTAEGWPAGRLSYRRDGNQPTTLYFAYSAETVRKAKSSPRSDRNTRDAEKISNIISILKRNSEVPTAAAGFKSENYAISCAINSIGRGDRAPSISLDNSAVVAAVESMLGVDSPNIELRRDEIQKAYDVYLEKFRDIKDKTKTKKRFSEGCKLIGLVRRYDDVHYMVGRITFDEGDERNIVLQGDLKRYTTLADTELATDAAIIRTYMQAKFPGETNELGVPRTDKYFEEVDISVGYSGNYFTWVLIPERGE